MPLLLLLLAGAAAAEPVERKAITVVDGDTVQWSGQRWRLLDFDAPDTTYAQCEAERVIGLKAAARMRELVASGEAVMAAKSEIKDRHGRRLGRLTVDGRDVGDTLVAEGLARSYKGGPRKSWCD